MYIEIYQNNKCVYNGYTHAETLKDIDEEFGSDKPLPGTHQGGRLKAGDIVKVKFSDNDEPRYYNYIEDGVFKCVEKGRSFDFDEMSGVKVIMMQPGFPAVITRIRSNLKDLQNAVSDHREPSLIEYSFPYPDDCMILGNEEAKLINMPLNRELNGELYAGTIFVVKDDGYGNLTDLSDNEIDVYMKRNGQPETFDESAIRAHPYMKYFGYFD